MRSINNNFIRNNVGLIAAICFIAAISLLSIMLPLVRSAYAAQNADGSTLDVEIIGNTTDGPNVTSLCPANRNKPNFTAYIETPSIHIDLAPNAQGQSLLRYDLTVKWRTCDRDTKGYAIYGKKFCPTSGYYGGEGTADPEREEQNYLTFDCVKYIDNNGNDYVKNDALGCPYLGDSVKNPGYPCTLADARALNVFRRGQQPDKSGATVLVLPNLAKSIGGRPNAQTTNSSQDSYSGKICQYFWFANQSAQQSDNSVCVNLTITYKWTYTPPPSYELDPILSPPLNNESFSYFRNFNLAWGASVRSEQYLRSEGIGNHKLDLWKIVYNGAPAGWAAGSITGDAGPCGALPGNASCVRVGGQYDCPNVAAFGCGTLNAAGQYWQWNYDELNSGPYPVGTRVCFISRVSKPNYTSSDSQWRGSAQECSVSAKKPRVQFLGSDLRVGGKAESSYYTVNDKNYGSWTEYGSFAGSTNSLVTSGNSFRTPNSDPSNTWNRLTFTNAGSSAHGNYNPVPGTTHAGLAYTYFSGLTPSGSGVPSAGIYNYAPNNLGGFTIASNGTTLIIRKNGTLTIDGNIQVNNQNVPSARDLSQVVIIADNIIIGKDVDRVDAWLITKPGQTPGGYINTCSDMSALTSNVCSTPLTINGAIYTDRLLLRRTAGANLPEAQIGQPAEKFNLRPDTQLWAYTYANKADFAQTDYVQELPPRY